MAVVSDTAPAPSAAAAAAAAAAAQPHASASSSTGGPNAVKNLSPGTGVKGWSQVVRGEAAPPADAAAPNVVVTPRSDAPAAPTHEQGTTSGASRANFPPPPQIGGDHASHASSKAAAEEPASSKIESEPLHPEVPSSSKGDLGQGGDHVVMKPAKPAWKNASCTLGKTPATGPVMGAVTWPTLGDARQSKTVPSEQPLKNPTAGAPSANSTSQQVRTWT